MRDDQGFEILVNAVPRTFRDRREAALDAALVIKTRSPNDIVEIVERASGAKSLIKDTGRLV